MNSKKQNQTCTFDELKQHVEKLNELLKNPEFGLISWREFYAFHMKSISNYWTKN